MNMKKIAILALSLCMIAAIAVTGTIAYFTDADADHNVFTIGNIDIEQLEVYDDEDPMLPTKPMGKLIEVENEGNSDVYFRTIFAFEDTRNLTQFNNGETLVDIIFPDENSSWEWTDLRFQVDNEENSGCNEVYRIAYYISEEPVTPGTYGSVLETITVGEQANNAWRYYAERNDLHYNMIAMTQATQTEGFDNAATALDTTFGPIDEGALADLITMFNQANESHGFATEFTGFTGPLWYEYDDMGANGVVGNNEIWDMDDDSDADGELIINPSDPLYYDYVGFGEEQA